MHLIIPYASSCSEACAAALPGLKLPHLQQLLSRLSPLPIDPGDEYSLSPPHERALAKALGLPVTDGQIPWAALQAHQLPQPGSDSAWAFITLCHWQVNTQHIAMSHLPLANFSAAQSDELLAAMRPYFEEDGITLHAMEPGRWLAQGEVFAEVASAALDRVVGRPLDAWMPKSVAAAPLRRLQNEMQMLLYTHPVYDARVASGLTPVNSFWFSGTGALPAGYALEQARARPTQINTLRAPALAENWSAWIQAWHTLDVTTIQPLLSATSQGQTLKITLCGERSSQSWQTQPRTLIQKVKGFFGSQPLSVLLEKL